MKQPSSHPRPLCCVPCPRQTNLRTNFFQVYENGHRLLNAHRILNVTAFLMGLVAMIIILTTKAFRVSGWPLRQTQSLTLQITKKASSSQCFAFGHTLFSGGRVAPGAPPAVRLRAHVRHVLPDPLPHHVPQRKWCRPQASECCMSPSNVPLERHFVFSSHNALSREIERVKCSRPCSWPESRCDLDASTLSPYSRSGI
jgi:hypothetical protein